MSESTEFLMRYPRENSPLRLKPSCLRLNVSMMGKLVVLVKLMTAEGGYSPYTSLTSVSDPGALLYLL